MWQWLLAQWLVLLPLLGGVPAAAPAMPEPPEQSEPDARQVPVLLYHHLAPEAVRENGAVITVREFEEQMAWLKRKGYTAITTADLTAWLSGERRLPSRSVLITFDDGYRSNYTHAYPVLKRYGLKATLFMISVFAGTQPGTYEFLSWAEIREMAASGTFEIQAHSHDGHRYVDGSPALLAWTPQEFRDDLGHLRRAFVEQGLPMPTAYAYPFGGYDSDVLRALEGTPVRLAFTIQKGLVRRGDPPLLLKRQIIFPGTGLGAFEQLVTGAVP